MSRARTVRRVAFAIAVLVLAGALIVVWYATRPGPMAFVGAPGVDLRDYLGDPTGAPADLPELRSPMALGRYLTQAADCEACHTAPGGRPFAGGRAFRTKFGTLYSPNITPDAQTGIGKWTNRQFVQAVHEGIRPDGARLYPAFPYASYTHLTDADVLAIKSYLATVAPVQQVAPENELSFPFNQRWLMVFWSAFFNSREVFRPIPQQGPVWNRGAYLVEALGHCGECHTPRNLLQGLDNGRKFAGAVADGWQAYNITSDKGTGIGAWSDADLAGYLATGHASKHGTASGPMGEAVALSLRHLSPADIDAMTTYLRSIPAIASPGLPAVLAGPASSSHDSGAALHFDDVGKQIFESACASCHAWTGAGTLTAYATLTGSRAVNDPAARNVVQIILSGAPARYDDPSVFMPGFAHAYTDLEIAALANYVTARFGARSSTLDARDVAILRGGG